MTFSSIRPAFPKVSGVKSSMLDTILPPTARRIFIISFFLTCFIAIILFFTRRCSTNRVMPFWVMTAFAPISCIFFTIFRKISSSSSKKDLIWSGLVILISESILVFSISSGKSSNAIFASSTFLTISG